MVWFWKATLEALEGWVASREWSGDEESDQSGKGEEQLGNSYIAPM